MVVVTANQVGVSTADPLTMTAEEKARAASACVAYAGPFEVKCTSIWIKGSDAGVAFSVAAGLTNVKAGDFPVVTGSNGFTGVG
jgi:hypothetical protein